ncbi:MAG: TIR domain-containing protein [Spirochaetaceae bacterium]
MEKENQLKIFISYQHDDEDHIIDFGRQVTPLITNKEIKLWKDRKVTGGEQLFEVIEQNLRDSDIILLFISSNFLASPACLEEKRIAIELNKEKNTRVIPIILSPCGWLDDKEIPHKMVFPTDGKEITSFPDKLTGWNDVYNSLKKVIEEDKILKNYTNNKDFLDFLNSTDFLKNSHSKKMDLELDDIYIPTNLEFFDDIKNNIQTISSAKLLEFNKSTRFIIAGENQSGKTTLCKKLYKELRSKNLFPIYVSGQNKYLGTTENIISESIKQQYNFDISELNPNKIIIILDNFQFAINKEKHLSYLDKYKKKIIVIDDIYNFGIKDKSELANYQNFKIKEFNLNLRTQLVEKWICIGLEPTKRACNEHFLLIDKTSELVETSLGKIIGTGIMPSFPFFILSIIISTETFEKPLDQDITSQGYCYQALIYLYLRKQGIKNSEIDTYINFITEYSYFLYKSDKSEISEHDFKVFIGNYTEKYNLSIKIELILKNLCEAQVIKISSTRNYSFTYPYIFYFFVARYFSEHLETEKGEIDIIINNLHMDRNAYITIFISHHSKNNYVLDEIILNAYCLFDKHKEATLSSDELAFFDEQEEIIAKAVLSDESNPDETRAKRLKNTSDITVESPNNVNKENDYIDNEENKKYNQIPIELRKSIKTIEVMGRIIKNRSGSLEKKRLESIFEEGVNVYLRLLTSFFGLIQNEEEINTVIKYIESRLKEHIDKLKEDDKTLDQDAIEKISKNIFWNMNFFTVFGIIDKLIHSLGSDSLINVVTKVCDNIDTPVSNLIRHGIFMQYNKNVRTDEIEEMFKDLNFSETAKKIIRFMIVEYSKVHHIDFRDKQKIQNQLGIPVKTLLKKESKHIKDAIKE